MPQTVFNKTRGLDQTTDSSNVKEQAMKKAMEVYQKMNIFNKIPVNAKQIQPLNNIELKKKER